MMDQVASLMGYAGATLDTGILRRFDASGPRYTSYPTADRFIEAFDANVYASWLARRGIGGFGDALSLYVHLPFCNTICFYCGCNKIVTRDRGRASKYLKYIEKEVRLQSGLLDRRGVVQLHWGGGTPTFLGDAELTHLMDSRLGQVNQRRTTPRSSSSRRPGEVEARL